jgi:PhnB protein
MKLTTYLNFDGNTREAFEFYAGLLGGKIVAMMTYGDTPGCENMAEADRDKIMHARLEIGGDALMATDSTPGYPYHKIRCAYVVFDADSPADAERIFAALSDGGQVEMPMQETFWAHRYGITVDRFGVPWMINHAKPMPAG